MSAKPCPFCNLAPGRVIDSDRHGLVFRDAYPVSPGHTLVIPRRHVTSFFDLTAAERESLFVLLDSAKRRLDEEMKPSAYNIGINDGPAAGQTVPHAHIHLIPRYAGDVTDPRGGVRWIFPKRADYWSGR